VTARAVLSRWAATCAAAAVVAGVAFAVDKLGDAKAKLGSSDGRQRRSAVGELAQIASAEAWKAVLGALSDHDGQVADEAQLRIAQIEDPAVRKLLLGKDGLAAKDPLVRERVAESLGRWSTRPGVELLSAPLGDREARVRRAAAWSVERLSQAGRFAGAWDSELVEMSALAAALSNQAGREKDAETFAALSVAEQRLLETPREEDIRSLLTHKAPAARAAALIALRAAKPESALAACASLANDAAPGVRANVALTLAELSSKAAALELVALLENERELRLRWRIVELLRGLSGQGHRLDVRPWRDWAQGLPDGAIDAPKAAGARAAEPSSSAFAGMPILSERVTFLIDLSGSMWEKRADGKTRKQVVDGELARALQSLTPGVRFNVIVYTARPVAWKERLASATPKAVQEALTFFEGRKDSGVGDFWEALELAWQDPDVDTVIVLSDGAPSGGERWNLELMKDLFAERNRFRQVALDAALAGASKRLREHWVEMCASSGGRVVDVKLD